MDTRTKILLGLVGVAFLIICGLIVDRVVQINQNNNRISAIEGYVTGLNYTQECTSEADVDVVPGCSVYDITLLDLIEEQNK